MKHISFISLVLAVACGCGHAHAQDAADWRQGLYVKGAGAVNVMRDHDFNTASGQIDTDMDTGYGISGAVGYDYGQVRAEVEMAYRQNDVSSHTLAGTGALANPGGDVSSLAVMVNGYYDFDTQSPLTPYVGAGIGVANVDFQDYASGATNAMSGDDTTFAYQAIAGLEYEFVDHLSALVEYRYFATSDIDVDSTLGGNLSTDTSYGNHSFLLGLKYDLY